MQVQQEVAVRDRFSTDAEAGKLQMLGKQSEAQVEAAMKAHSGQ